MKLKGIHQRFGRRLRQNGVLLVACDEACIPDVPGGGFLTPSRTASMLRIDILSEAWPLGNFGPELDGGLDGGPPMSPVDFREWQTPLSLFHKFPCQF